MSFVTLKNFTVAPLPKRCMLKILTVLGLFDVLNQLLHQKMITSWYSTYITFWATHTVVL